MPPVQSTQTTDVSSFSPSQKLVGLSPAKSSFVTLGLDLILHILQFLLPQDIICIGKTCSTIHSMIKNRSLWVNTLRRVLYENGISECGYALEKWTVRWLQHAALTPSRFTTLYETIISAKPRAAGYSLTPVAARLLVSGWSEQEAEEFSVDITNPQNFVDILPVYGGRYLATLLRNERRQTVLQFWDLGLGCYSKFKLMASQLLDSTDDIWACAVMPLKDASGVYIILTTESSLSYTFSAYKLDLTTDSPVEFKKWGEMQIIQHASHAFNNSDRRLVSVSRHNAYLWDLDSNTWWGWKLAGVDPYDRQCMVYLYENTLMVSDKNLAIFGLPELFLTSPFVEDCPLPELKPECIIPSPCESVFTDGHGHIDAFANGFALAKNVALPYPQIYAIFNRQQFYLHEMKPRSERDDNLPAQYLPVLTQKFGGLPFMSQSTSDFGPIQRINGHTMIAWSDHSHTTFNLTRFPLSPDSETSATVRLVKASDYTISWSFFYAATGRCCTLTTNGDAYILEYMGSPDESPFLSP